MQTGRLNAPEAGAPRIPRTIGPVGKLARAAVGLAFIALALFWREPDWQDAVLGLVAMPALVLAVMALRARRSPQPLSATGPVGHVLNLAILVPLFVLPATAGAAFLFLRRLDAGRRRPQQWRV